jgi:hypothetical protein
MMKLAFKRSSGFTGKAIDLLSGGRGFCHVELILPSGISFSSTTMGDASDVYGNGKKNGCRFKQIGYSSKGQWAFAKLFVPIDGEDAIFNKCNELVETNEGYDRNGVLRFIPPHLLREHPKKYFCDEACITGLQAYDGMILTQPEGGEAAYLDYTALAPWRIAPNDLAEMCGVE